MRKGKIRFAAVVVLAVLALTEAASAFYSPALGRFLNRDPLGEPGAALVRQAARPATGFIPRDPAIVQSAASRFVRRDPRIVEPVANPLVPFAPSGAQPRIDQPDPRNQYMDGMNLYQYVENSPVNWVDPSGLLTVHIWNYRGKDAAWGHASVTLEDGTPIADADDQAASRE